MKKVLFITVLLAISLTLTFAQDVTAKIVGEAGTMFEIDLDASGTGFITSASAGIEIDASTGGREHTAEEDVYGYVKISGLDLGQFRMGWYNSADGWAQAWLGGFTGNPWKWDQLEQIEMAQTLGVNVEGSEPKNPSIEAKLIAGPVAIKFDGNTYLRSERFLDGKKLQFKNSVGDNDDGAGLGLKTMWCAPFDGASGVIDIGYDSDMFGLNVKVSTPNAASDNADNAYAFGLDVNVKAVENLELTLGGYGSVNYLGDETTTTPGAVTEDPVVGWTIVDDDGDGVNDGYDVDGDTDSDVPLTFNTAADVVTVNDPRDNNDKYTVGVKVGYTIAVSEDISIKPYAGAEILLQADADLNGDMQAEIGGGIDITWPGTGWDYAWGMGDSFIDYWVGWPQHFINSPGFMVCGNYLINPGGNPGGADPADDTVNIKIQAYDDFGDGGLIPKMGLGLLAVMNDLTNNPTIGAALYANMELMPGVAPFVSMDMLMEDDAATQAAKLDLNIGVEITAIPNVIITLVYDGNNLMPPEGEDPVLGIIRAWFRFKYY